MDTSDKNNDTDTAISVLKIFLTKYSSSVYSICQY